jgi:hypothetical protein
MTCFLGAIGPSRDVFACDNKAVDSGGEIGRASGIRCKGRGSSSRQVRVYLVLVGSLSVHVGPLPTM